MPHKHMCLPFLMVGGLFYHQLPAGSKQGLHTCYDCRVLNTSTGTYAQARTHRYKHTGKHVNCNSSGKHTCLPADLKGVVGAAGGHWFFLPGLQCWQMGRWMLPKQDMAHVAISIRQVARLLRTLHDTFAEVMCHGSMLCYHVRAIQDKTEAACWI